jgi:hypothetical protein
LIARVAVWEPMPDDDRQWVIDAAKTVPGVRDGYCVGDPATGNGLSIAFFEDDVDLGAVKGRGRRNGGRDSLAQPATSSTPIRNDLPGPSQQLADPAPQCPPVAVFR